MAELVATGSVEMTRWRRPGRREAAKHVGGEPGQRHPHGQDGKGFQGAHHQQGVTLPDGSDREVLQQ